MSRATVFDPGRREELLSRLRGLRPETPPRWGRMTAPQMVAHLTDQMGHALGDNPCTPVRGPLRWPGVRYLSIYWVPWPKGRIQAPPDALVTKPVSWETDLAALLALVERMADRDPEDDWPDHGLFGRMSGRDWGFFVHKHFDHHLRQFGR